MTDPISSAPEQPEPAHADTPTIPAPRIDVDRTETTVPDRGQAHDPWSREAQTVAVVPADTATAFPESTIVLDPLSDATPATATSARRRTPIVLAIAAVLVILIGAGAYAGIRYYTGAGITEPESAVPASVTAFARVDLRPGLRDKLSFNDLVKKFPTNGASTQDLVTKLETQVAKAAGLNYGSDVKPWFGGQAGAAAWTNAAGHPVALLVFSSKDDAKARAALTKVRAKQGASFGFVLRGGYALIAGANSGAQSDAAAAASAAAAHNLAGSAVYRSAAAHISAHNLVIAYVDLGKFGALMTREMGNISSLATSALGDGGDGSPLPAGTLSGMTGLGGGGISPFAKLAGTAIVGASVVGDGIEIRAHVQGVAGSSGTHTNVRPTMDSMSAATTVGLAANGIDPNSDTGKQLSQMLNNMPAMSGGQSGGSSMMSVLAGPLMSILTSKEISLSLTGVTNRLPTGFLAIDTRDTASATSLMSTINGLTGGKPPVPGMTITQDGTHIQATMGGLAGTGKLGATSLYTETTAGMSNEDMMAYVDVTKLVALLQSNGAAIPAKIRTEIAPIQAIGIGSTISGTTEDELIRIIIR